MRFQIFKFFFSFMPVDIIFLIFFFFLLFYISSTSTYSLALSPFYLSLSYTFFFSFFQTDYLYFIFFFFYYTSCVFLRITFWLVCNVNSFH